MPCSAFAVKHLALKRIREICNLYRQKWRASGPLAMLERGGASARLSTALVGRHLALREADGSLSVHPAVRDYFRQLATASEQGFWHQLIRRAPHQPGPAPGLAVAHR